MSILITICIALVSIMIHEAGHFLAGKIFNYAIDEFSIGLGPKLIQKNKNGTAYTLRLLPLGGYVSFAEESKNKRCMSEPSLLKFVVLIMGVVFNVLLSILCFAIIYGMAGYDFFTAILESIRLIGNTLSSLFGSPSQLVSIDGYGSIVLVASNVNQFMNIASNWRQLIAYLLAVGASLNLGIAILNLFPLPILDGGQIIINTIELIIRRSIPKGVKAGVNVACWLLIMAFGIFLIARDVISLV